MFILNQDPFLMPSYGISPFGTADMNFNKQLPDSDFATVYFDKRFGAGHWQYTYNGREAIKIALENYNLDSDDMVTILTTSENLYISSCVTNTIEKFCRWNRGITPETKIVFVNHEFGYPHPNMEKLVATGLPIIEDCCTTFFSQDRNEKVGKYGDYTVYSFPKFFPIQIGGLLVSNKKKLEIVENALNDETSLYIEKVVSYYLKNTAEILHRRNQNFSYASSLFVKYGFAERFEKEDLIVPSVLLLNNNGVVKDLSSLKVFLGKCGIQSSVFYGEDAFFIPTYQSLESSDYDYFFNCIQEFLKSQ